MTELNMSSKDMQYVIETVLQAAATDGCSLFGNLPPDGTCPLLNGFLQHIHDTMEHRPLDELSVILRSSYQWKDGCPAWQPLLEATEKLGRGQYSEQDVNDALFGMIDANR